MAVLERRIRPRTLIHPPHARWTGANALGATQSGTRRGRSAVSAFLRTRVLDAKPAKARRRVIKRHPISGLLYDATDEGGQIVTHEQIKVALADVP